ncbi:hypothetical protein K456DRAFT_364331 [Colletotrichum gloeosporioides 23]|nr:hypothetical protein K456DRAFT_364331 [Colletotrichum gloeosporioides 23]
MRTTSLLNAWTSTALRPQNTTRPQRTARSQRRCWVISLQQTAESNQRCGVLEITARFLTEAKMNRRRTSSIVTPSRRRCKLPDRRPTPARGRIMSNDRCTRGEQMSCGILPRDLAGDLQGRDVLAVSNEALGIFGWSQ